MEIHALSENKLPSLLSEIPDPPKQLFFGGNIDLLHNSSARFLCVVGSRKCTAYGKQAVEHLIEGLRGYPIVIVSGLALGVDALAHKAALSAGLSCIAVPGSGLSNEVLYPRSHFQLAKQILKRGGLLLSEFEPNQKAALWTFPKRNRIMVGLSHATLLIEAEEKSGTLITARLTSEYNRDLLVVPGSIFSNNSKGTHQFLKLGATPVTSAEDILEALGIETRQAPESRVVLSEQEQAVHALLNEPMPRDELIEKLSLPITEANVLLSKMELKNLLKEEMGIVRKV